MLVDIVSKNGNLLLNIPQRPDGALDAECTWILKGLARWIGVNGEGIQGTRPWKQAGEGPSRGAEGQFKEEAVNWTAEDFRFTEKAGAVYAFQMKWPEDRTALIKNLASHRGPKVAGVRLLGSDANLPHEQTDSGLKVRLPEKPTSEYAHGIHVRLG